MVAPLPQSKREAIKQRLDENTPHISIAEEMSVSIQTVKNYSTTLKQHDVVLLPSVSRRGRPPRMTREMLDVLFSKAQSERFLDMIANDVQALRTFIEESPHVYREEMVDFIAEEFDIDVSVVTISRTLQKERISRKKVLFLPSQYSALLLILATKNCTRTVSIA